MMEDDDLKDSRRASAQSFFQSLDELFDYIEAANPDAVQPQPQSQSQSPQAKPPSESANLPKKAKAKKINLSDFEDAIADLEQFIQNKRQNRPESNQ